MAYPADPVDRKDPLRRDLFEQMGEIMAGEYTKITGMVLVEIPVSLAGALEDAGVLHRTGMGKLRMGGPIA